MKTTDAPVPAWNLLGELELSFRADAERAIPSWLAKVLAPLDLPADFMSRILRSAQEAVMRTMQPDSAAFGVDHIHMLIFITPDHRSSGKTWGFFRIEKLDGTGKDHNPHDHAIEFYLYRERQ